MAKKARRRISALIVPALSLALSLLGACAARLALPTPAGAIVPSALCRQETVAADPFSALVVQGDISGAGYREAVQFLHGCSLECLRGLPCKGRPYLHPPAEWSAHHGHSVLKDYQDYSPFYVDASIPGGMDYDSPEGLESANLVFYAGHGYPDSLAVRDDKSALLAQFSLGDGHARYLWMLSCHVMAHGPKDPVTIGDSTIVGYLAPHRFQPLQVKVGDNGCDAEGHRNAFCRWGRLYGMHMKSPLGQRLRLACGGSTEVGGNAFPSAPVWQYKLITGLDVADSLLLGFSVGFRVAACLTRGARSPLDTPLYDSEFTKDPNRVGAGGYLYLQYPVRNVRSLEALRAQTAWLPWSSFPQPPPMPEPPRTYPVLRAGPMPLPQGFEVSEPQEGQSLEFGAQPLELTGPLAGLRGVMAAFGVAGEEIVARRSPRSGAILLTLASNSERGAELAPMPPPGGGNPTLEEMLASSLSPFAPLDKPDFGTAMPRVGLSLVADLRAMVIDQAAEDQATEPKEGQDFYIRRYLKCLYFRIQGVVDRAGGAVAPPQLGEGSDLVFLQICPRYLPSAIAELPQLRGVLAAGTGEARLLYLRREVANDEMWPVRRRGRAELDAWRLLDEGVRSAYQRTPALSRWGYRTAPLHCGQQRMILVYEFDFVPKQGPKYEHYPIRTIEVAAHEGLGYEDWDCDARSPAER